MRTCGRVPIPKKNLFHACMMLATLSTALEEGYRAQEFAEAWEKKRVDQLALEAHVAGVIALLIDTLDEETNRELARYSLSEAQIEFEDGCVFLPETRTIPRPADCVQVPKAVLFEAFVELERYDEFGDSFDPGMITKNEDAHAFLRAQLHGRARFENARKKLLKYMATQKGMIPEYAMYVAREAHFDAEIWIG